MKTQGLWASLTGSFAGLCCAGSTVILSFLSGLGLGFLINDLILFPLLFLSFGFVWYSLNLNKKTHKNNMPLYSAIGSMALIMVGIFVQPLIWVGILGLISATIWDFTLCRRCKPSGLERK